MKMGIEFWSAHVAAAKLSGLSGMAYAKHHGISVKGLYYWQNKLKPTSPKPITPNKSAQASKFMTLRVADLAGVDATADAHSSTDAHAQRFCQCSLLLPSGLRLELSALPDPLWLAQMSRISSGVR